MRNIAPLWGHNDSITCTMSREGKTGYRAETHFECGAYASPIIVTHKGEVAAWLALIEKHVAYHKRYGYTIRYVWEN